MVFFLVWFEERTFQAVQIEKPRKVATNFDSDNFRIFLMKIWAEISVSNCSKKKILYEF